MADRIIKFPELDQSQLDAMTDKGENWEVSLVDNMKFGDWTHITDPKYGTINHIAVTDQEGNPKFDKIDIEWKPAAFVVIYRLKGDQPEFFLPNERRILLRDENGIQGNTFIRNIPQGLIKVDQAESPQQAALREVKEETGITPKNIFLLEEKVYFDAANSGTGMPFFIAEVDSQTLQQYNQNLEDSEDIKAGEEDWFSLKDIQKLQLQCAKTMSGLWLAMAHLEID